MMRMLVMRQESDTWPGSNGWFCLVIMSSELKKPFDTMGRSHGSSGK